MAATYGMNLRAVVWAILLAVLAAAVPPAGAAIVNGDFEDATDFNGWSSMGGGTKEILDSYGTNTTRVAHIYAEATYTHDGSVWNGTHQDIHLMQFNIGLGGQTVLQFDALAVISGQEQNPPEVSVPAVGGVGGDETKYITSSSWTTYQINIVATGGGAPPSNAIISIDALAQTNAPVTWQGTSPITQRVDLYLDNFELVPLPGAGVILLAGSVVVLRRRRRRNGLSRF